MTFQTLHQAEEDGRTRETRLLRQRDALIRLNGKENVLGDDVGVALRRILAEDAKAIEVSRVSFWEFAQECTELRCVVLCNQGVPDDTVGMTLSSSLYPRYFRALEETDVIAADDAVTDPLTAEFADGYLRPLGITSMMDAPVLLHGVARGLICHEHVGPQRHWSSDEQTFAVAIANLVSLVLEVRERHRAEMALRKSESILRSFYESCPLMMGVVELSEENTVIDVYSNPAAARMDGDSPAIICGIFAGDATVKEVAEVWVTNFRRSQAQGSAVHFEYMHPTPKGARPIDVTVSPVGETNQRALFSYVAEDISAHVRLEERLRHAQKMEAIGTLASGIAHDFNNILASMIGYTELAQVELPEDSQERQDLDMALSAANRGKNVVQQMLTFSRQVEEERNPEHLGVIVNDAVRSLRTTTPATIDFQVHIEKDTAPILADASQLHRMIANLCTNAHHAMEDKGGVIRIVAGNKTIDSSSLNELHDLTEGLYVRLSVSDTGCGMDQRTRKRIFEPFFTTKPQGKGTGLGLAMVHGIVLSHGGAITVDTKLGAGTTVTIYLPAWSFPVPETADPLSVGPGCRESILVVDDEKAIATLIQRTLSGFGYNVVALTSGTEALAAVHDQPDFFDLVITDQSMPAMNGRQLAAELHKAQPNLPVIMVTGFAEPEDGTRCELAATVAKPMKAGELTRVVRTVLDSTARRRPTAGAP